MPIILGPATVAFLVWTAMGMPLGSWRMYRRMQTSSAPPNVRKRYVGAMASVLLTGGIAILAGMENKLTLPLQRSWLGLFLSLVYVVILVFGVARGFRKRPASRERLRRLFGPKNGADLCLAFVTSLCAGVLEEVAYRGVLFLLVSRVAGTVAAVVVACVVFGAAHFAQSPRSALGVAFLGLVFQLLALISESLVPSMVLHTLYDAGVFMLLYRLNRVTAQEANAAAQSA